MTMLPNAAAVMAVERIHSRRDFHGDGYGWTVCVECRQAWPCATIQAIDDAFGRERYPNGTLKPSTSAARGESDG